MFEAQVIAAHGRHLTVCDAQGRRHEARPFGRRLVAVCGDRVRCEEDRAHDEIHVLEVLPRRSLLTRSNLRGMAEPVVANTTLLVTVLAPRPAPDPFIIDRYLCAASSAAMAAIVLINKVDLMTTECSEQERMQLDALRAEYESAGYPAIVCSVRDPVGLAALRDALRDQTSVFVGQSGVGKSSLIAALIPEAALVTGELDREQEGRHTTTAARLYELPGGGALIDSPGVRDFAPAIDALEPRSLGFPEVDRLAPGCRFLDCQHLREPHCAVRSASEDGRLPPRRYESYRRLRRLYDELNAARGPARR